METLSQPEVLCTGYLSVFIYLVKGKKSVFLSPHLHFRYVKLVARMLMISTFQALSTGANKKYLSYTHAITIGTIKSAKTVI